MVQPCCPVAMLAQPCWAVSQPCCAAMWWLAAFCSAYSSALLVSDCVFEQLLLLAFSSAASHHLPASLMPSVLQAASSRSMRKLLRCSWPVGSLPN